jgi:hypothetical protein
VSTRRSPRGGSSNFTAPLGDRLRAGVQLFSRSLGSIGDYRAKLD